MGLDLDKHGIRRRVHRRLAMTPVAQPLQCVQSPDELIVVLADAMEAHAAILERCGILHSDLSTGNILVHHDSNGRTTGTLIDFDYAIRVGSDEGEGEGSGRTGTLPYMSICCLDGRGVRRTALDDYESLIYIIGFLGFDGTLFYNEKVSPSSRGCWPTANPGAQAPHQSDADFYDANVAAEITDPFARRAEVADRIARDLLNTLKEARDAAKGRMVGQ
ncbi:hypothetical protein H4R18_004906 [Coemansia javaensis]|uniref:Protein kinase domain-containing protein n=1 Tax=Coemansia javaensis TaxID=2761396 RepID=A0A9W8HAV0_9FUNG|nr:hypothetical protein H4R18_004906 [Coemansia javaensis]